MLLSYCFFFSFLGGLATPAINTFVGLLLCINFVYHSHNLLIIFLHCQIRMTGSIIENGTDPWISSYHKGPNLLFRLVWLTVGQSCFVEARHLPSKTWCTMHAVCSFFSSLCLATSIGKGKSSTSQRMKREEEKDQNRCQIIWNVSQWPLVKHDYETHYMKSDDCVNCNRRFDTFAGNVVLAIQKWRYWLRLDDVWDF